MRKTNSHSLARKSGRPCGQQIHNSDVQRNAGAQERLDAVRQDASTLHVLLHAICSLYQVSLKQPVLKSHWLVYSGTLVGENLLRYATGILGNSSLESVDCTDFMGGLPICPLRKILLLRFLQKRCGITYDVQQSGKHSGKVWGEFGSLACVERYITILHLGLEPVPIHRPLRRHSMKRALTSPDLAQTLNNSFLSKSSTWLELWPGNIFRDLRETS